jgi:uncharacterized protein YhaN
MAKRAGKSQALRTGKLKRKRSRRPQHERRMQAVARARARVEELAAHLNQARAELERKILSVEELGCVEEADSDMIAHTLSIRLRHWLRRFCDGAGKFHRGGRGAYDDLAVLGLVRQRADWDPDANGHVIVTPLGLRVDEIINRVGDGKTT